MTAPRGTDAEKAPQDAGTAARTVDEVTSTTVLPGGGSGGAERRTQKDRGAPAGPGTAAAGTAPAAGAPAAGPADGPRRPPAPRTVPGRPAGRGELRPAAERRSSLVGKSRRARLSLRRFDPWSVFLFSLVASVFVGIALVVAVAVLFVVLGALGVTGSLNELFGEVTGGAVTSEPLLTAGRVVGGTAVLAAVNVVFLTLLATLGALLYNLCASFTGGIELTLGERD